MWTATASCNCVTQDACGVCNGDGSTCAGCDGVPNSGSAVDACGICDGDGSSCAGCDGVPNSDKVPDTCGVCGGDGTACDHKPRLVVEVYVPTPAELDALGLDPAQLAASETGTSPLRGSDVGDFERLHVTARMAALSEDYDTCRYRIRVSANEHFTGYAAEELGCTLGMEGSSGECTLEIPTMLADAATRKLWLGAEVAPDSPRPYTECEWPDSPDSALLVLLAPFTILRECEPHFFWSETKQECEACAVPGASALCPLGTHLAGCDILAGFPEEGSPCAACPLPVGVKPSYIGTGKVYQWSSNSDCAYECQAGAYWQNTETGVCMHCSIVEPNDCAVGEEPSACTPTADSHCADCPPIARGIYADNEEYFVPGDCTQTRCKPGNYSDGTVCRGCATLEELRLGLDVVREAGKHYRFHDCTQTSNARADICTPPDYFSFSTDVAGGGLFAYSRDNHDFAAFMDQMHATVFVAWPDDDASNTHAYDYRSHVPLSRCFHEWIPSWCDGGALGYADNRPDCAAVDANTGTCSQWDPMYMAWNFEDIQTDSTGCWYMRASFMEKNNGLFFSGWSQASRDIGVMTKLWKSFYSLDPYRLIPDQPLDSELGFEINVTTSRQTHLFLSDAPDFDTPCAFECAPGFTLTTTDAGDEVCAPCTPPPLLLWSALSIQYWDVAGRQLPWAQAVSHYSTKFPASSGHYHTWQYIPPGVITTAQVSRVYTYTQSGCRATCLLLSPEAHSGDGAGRPLRNYTMADGTSACFEEPECPSGTYPAFDTHAEYSSCDHCVSAYSTAANFVFVGPGAFEEPSSCPEGCADGFYEDFGTCRPVSNITTLECGPGEFAREATLEADAFCQTCSACPEGMQETAPCAADFDTECELCYYLQPANTAYMPENKRYTGTGADACTLACVEGTQAIYGTTIAKGGQIFIQSNFDCTRCAAAAACAPGTQPPEALDLKRTSCAQCEPCSPPAPADATLLEGCAWKCPSGLQLTRASDGSEACAAATASAAAVFAPTPAMRAAVSVCPAGTRLERGADSYGCVPCAERAPLPDAPPSWQWKISPCDQPEGQGWECLPGFFQFQEFPDAAARGLDAPLPECLPPVERARRLRLLRTRQELPAQQAQFESVPGAPPPPPPEGLGAVHVALIAVGGSLAVALMCFIALQHGAQVEGEGGAEA